MKKQLQQLIEFHTAFGVPLRTKPDPFNDTDEWSEIYRFRVKIMKEEIDEWIIEATYNSDIDKRAKELVDILYTVFGTVITEGLQDVVERVFDEVHKSNMSKLGEDGKPIKRADGKVLKGSNYHEPDLSFLLVDSVSKNSDDLDIPELFSELTESEQQPYIDIASLILKGLYHTEKRPKSIHLLTGNDFKEASFIDYLVIETAVRIYRFSIDRKVNIFKERNTQTKRQIYEDVTRRLLSDPSGTRMDIVYAAMDKYADQEVQKSEGDLIEDLMQKFEVIGIDTSTWEHEFGDGNSATEFIQAGIESYLQKFKNQENGE